eukprot:5613765-Pleurochrysis_carterae.AAC.1
MAEAGVDKICPSNCLICPLARSTVSFSLHGHHVHEGVRSERDGVVCGVLADADVWLLFGSTGRSSSFRQVRIPCFWNIALIERSVAQMPGT